jgi:hypothetical protein
MSSVRHRSTWLNADNTAVGTYLSSREIRHGSPKKQAHSSAPPVPSLPAGVGLRWCGCGHRGCPHRRRRHLSAATGVHGPLRAPGPAGRRRCWGGQRSVAVPLAEFMRLQPGGQVGVVTQRRLAEVTWAPVSEDGQAGIQLAVPDGLRAAGRHHPTEDGGFPGRPCRLWHGSKTPTRAGSTAPAALTMTNSASPRPPPARTSGTTTYPTGRTRGNRSATRPVAPLRRGGHSAGTLRRRLQLACIGPSRWRKPACTAAIQGVAQPHRTGCRSTAPRPPAAPPRAPAHGSVCRRPAQGGRAGPTVGRATRHAQYIPV